MSNNGTTRAVLRRPVPAHYRRHIEGLPEHLRYNALWRILKFGDPWPRHNRPLSVFPTNTSANP